MILIGKGYQHLFDAKGGEDACKDITAEWIAAELEEIEPALGSFIWKDDVSSI